MFFHPSIHVAFASHSFGCDTKEASPKFKPLFVPPSPRLRSDTEITFHIHSKTPCFVDHLHMHSSIVCGAAIFVQFRPSLSMYVYHYLYKALKYWPLLKVAQNARKNVVQIGSSLICTLNFPMRAPSAGKKPQGIGLKKLEVLFYFHLAKSSSTGISTPSVIISVCIHMTSFARVHVPRSATPVVCYCRVSGLLNNSNYILLAFYNLWSKWFFHNDGPWA